MLNWAPLLNHINRISDKVKLLPYIGLCILTVNLLSCGVNKNAGTAAETKGVSMLDYPYIEHFHEGLRLKSKGEIMNAISAFDYCLSVRQNDDAVYFALSELYGQKKDPVKMLESLKLAAKIAPDNIWYTQELAYQNFDQNKFDEAVKHFAKLVQKEPSNVDWLYGYAECLVKVGKVNEAIKALDKTEEQVGKQPELTIQKFKLYLQIKQPEKGIEEINKMRIEFPKDPDLLGTLIDYYFQSGQEKKAIEILQELAEVDPMNGRAHMFLAEVYHQQYKKKEYFDELKKGFICDDVDIDTKMKVLISILEEGTKISPEGFELLDLLVKKYPNDSKSYSIQGDYFIKAEKDDKALEAYKNALKYDKNKYTIWNQVLVMEYQAKKFSDLYDDSKACLEFFPANSSIYLFNGIAANQINKYDEAVAILNSGKELVVNDKALESEFYSQLGDAYFGLKKYEEGKENFEKALKIDPLSTLNMNNYAYRLALAKLDLEHAEVLISKANLISPNQAHFIDTYGWVLFQKGEYVKAKEFFDRAFDLNSGDRIILEHLGDVYSKIGSKEIAVEFWIKAKIAGSTNKNLNKKIEKKEYYEPAY